MSQIGYVVNSDILFTNRIPEIKQDINLVNNLKMEMISLYLFYHMN
jgi:hypothetical protein